MLMCWLTYFSSHKIWTLLFVLKQQQKLLITITLTAWHKALWVLTFPSKSVKVSKRKKKKGKWSKKMAKKKKAVYRRNGAAEMIKVISVFRLWSRFSMICSAQMFRVARTSPSATDKLSLDTEMIFFGWDIISCCFRHSVRFMDFKEKNVGPAFWALVKSELDKHSLNSEVIEFTEHVSVSVWKYTRK